MEPLCANVENIVPIDSKVIRRKAQRIWKQYYGVAGIVIRFQNSPTTHHTYHSGANTSYLKLSKDLANEDEQAALVAYTHVNGYVSVVLLL